MEFLGSFMISVVIVAGFIAGMQFEARYLRPRNRSVTREDCNIYLIVPSLGLTLLSLCFMLRGCDATGFVMIVTAGLMTGIAIALS